LEFSLQSDDLTVGELFSGRLAFVLPEFQRDYAWGVEQAEHLFEDIDAARGDQSRDGDLAPYFLGTMLFAEPEADDPLRQMQVVDGQQRITTLTILLAVLRDLETDLALQDRLHRHIAVWSTDEPTLGDAFHLTPRASDHDYLAQAVQKHGAITRRRRQRISAPVRTGATAAVEARTAHQNIDAVRAYFRRTLSNDVSEADRRAFAAFLLDHCRLLAMRTPSLDYAYQIFLTLNSRGLPLSGDDIVLAEVIGPLDRAQKARFAPIVKQMMRYRQTSERTRSRGKTFFSHIVAMNGWRAQSMIADLRRSVQANGGPAQFTRTVFQPMAEAYLLTRCDFGERAVSTDVAECLNRLALLEQLCDDEWVGVAMLGLANIALDDPKLVTFLTLLDRFAHAQLAIRPQRRERRKRYQRAAAAIKEAPQTFDPAQVFSLTQTEQNTVLRRLSNSLHTMTSRTDKAVLIRLDVAMSGRPASWYRELFASCADANESFSVEHVIPQGKTMPAKSGWHDVVPDVAMRKRLATSLGNLLLVMERDNRQVGQKEWDVKQKKFLGGEITSQFAMVQAVRDVSQWDGAFVAQRHEEMMALVRRIWSIESTADASDKPTAAKPASSAKPTKRLAKLKRR